MKERTALIWNEIEELKYAIVDGDLRKYSGVYINNAEQENLGNELSELIFDSKGEYKIEFSELPEIQDAVIHGAYLVECGFIP